MSTNDSGAAGPSPGGDLSRSGRTTAIGAGAIFHDRTPRDFPSRPYSNSLRARFKAWQLSCACAARATLPTVARPANEAFL